MYVPSHFSEDRIPVLHEAMRALAFGSLIMSGESGLEASHLPMMVDPEHGPRGALLGHLARGNPQWKAAPAGAQALAMFVGPNAYITPSWYPTKSETGKVVPTWNYLAVHAYGEIEFFDDPSRLRDHVTRLTQAHESARAAPWAVSDAPADYIDKMLGAIVGFTLTIARLEGKWKMSQNRVQLDRAGVLAGLTREGGAAQEAVADVMGGL